MAKIERTVLVYSSSSSELEGLRSALEPVLGKYRQATGFSEACSKAKNEKIDLIVLGSETDALKEYFDFYAFARRDPALKNTPIFVWAPVEPPTNFSDSKVRYFERGQFRQLVEGLDEFANVESPTDVASKTRQALPVFLQNLVPTATEKLSTTLGTSLLPQAWVNSTLPPAAELSALIKTHTSILEGFYAIRLSSKTPGSEDVGKAMDLAVRAAALMAAQLFSATRLTDFHSDITQDIAKESSALSSENWNCLPLLNSSQELVAQIFVKIRPKPAN